MNRPQIIQVGRDEHGITYSGDIETPAPQPVPTVKPVSVKTKAAAKKLGWVFQREDEAKLQFIERFSDGTEVYHKVLGCFEAEKICNDISGFRTKLYRCATTMKNLLGQIEQTENDRKRRGLQ